MFKLKGETFDSLKDKFDQSSPEITDLLKALLEFNHHFRLSTKECLKNKMFDDIRNEELEKGAPF